MATRVVVDPITRIEGHLRIEAEIKDGKIDTLKFFDVPGGQLRSSKGHVPA